MTPTRLLLAVFAVAAAGTAAAQEHRHDHGRGDAAEAPAAAGQPPGQGGRYGKREWTRLPLIVPAGRGGERAAVRLRALGMDVAELQVFAPEGPADKRKMAVPMDADGARIEPIAPKSGNYYWVLARSETDTEVRVASTTWYFSNPGAAPTAMLAAQKNELEIVPSPLPREHGGYRESEKWNFLLRFNGAPLPNQAVTMETEFGSRSTFVSDNEGRLVVLFPRDFKAAQEAPREGGHEMGPRRAGFVLAAEREDNGKHYLTTFNYTYSPDADRGKSLAWGAGFGLLGMVAATPLLRRRSAKPQETPHA